MDVLVFMYLRGRQMFKQHRIPVGGKPLVKLMPKASHERSGRRRLHGGKVLRKQWVELLVFSFCFVAFRCCSMSQLSCHASFTIVPLLELSIVGHWPEVSEGCCQVSKRSRSGMGARLASSCSWLCR
jgi:hypothetical protein